MTAPQWQQVRELFEAALEAEPADPRRWLDAQPADEAVRQEVASLLDHHWRAGDFLVESVVERVPGLLEEEDSRLEDGASVGHYTIGRELGRGAMGRVYLATDTRLGRRVALKALAPHLTGDASHRERLRREARAAASLTHAGICTVYALEEIDGQLFIASELVDGRTLRDEMAHGGALPAAGAIADTARELAEALASAHAKGITHRDFKPENIMRNADGRLKVLDFGLARVERPAATASIARATMPGALVGTPAYMSPEQLNGQPADPRSDVFAFGVVLYEYACGVHPFDAATPLGLAARVLESDADPIAHRCRHVPAAVAAVVDRCLRKVPADRFASAGDIADGLRHEALPRLSARSSSFLTMWRVHQMATMLLYVVAGTIAWWVKETSRGPLSLWTFVAIGLAGTVVGATRGHLLFTWRMNRPRLIQEWRRVRPAVVVIDLFMAAGLAVDGVSIVPTRPLWGMLTIAFSAGLVLATVLMEPATTDAAFDQSGS